MKAAALAVVLGLAVPAAAWASPQQPPDGIVTLKRKASTWSFKITPEGRKKAIVEDKEVEVDVPQRIYVAWAVDEPYVPLRGANPFTSSVNSNSATVSLFREGKRYESPDSVELLGQTRMELALLQKVLVEEFYQVDIDFPGGTWEDLAKLLRDRLAPAAEQQLPEILKPFLPAKVEIELSSKPGNQARYPAIQAKAVTLALLRSFGPAPVVEGRADTVPRFVQREEKNVELVMDVHKSLSRLVLSDGNSLMGSPENLEVAFYHLGGKSTVPGADHVVALFEMAWKARGGPLFAKVKYHPETKTLMVQGTADEIQAADRVFGTLTGQPPQIERSANPFDAITQSLEKIAELIEKQSASKDK